jgi:hypothetical protein
MGQAATEYFVADVGGEFMVVNQSTGEKRVDEKIVRQVSQLKNNVLTGSAGFAENQNSLRSWYANYRFRMFTQPDQFHKLPDMRKEVLDDLRRAARSREARTEVLRTTVEYMSMFARNQTRTGAPLNFHPAVRYNAMLLIGDLNAEEPSPQQRYPDPLPAALTFLVGEYKRPNQTDALKLGAIIGILRHVQRGPSRVPIGFSWRRSRKSIS